MRIAGECVHFSAALDVGVHGKALERLEKSVNLD